MLHEACQLAPPLNLNDNLPDHAKVDRTVRPLRTHLASMLHKD
jgi:hypothetical protein